MKRCRILVLTPTEIEASHLGLLPEGCTIEVCGVGMAETAAATVRMVTWMKPELVILAGIAGACSGSGLHTGDSVLVAEESIADLGSVRDGEFVGLYEKHYRCREEIMPEGWLRVTSRTVNTCPSRWARGGEIENMEGAAFFAVCESLGVDFLELRTISNIVGAPKNEWRIDEAAEELGSALHKLLIDL